MMASSSSDFGSNGEESDEVGVASPLESKIPSCSHQYLFCNGERIDGVVCECAEERLKGDGMDNDSS